MLFPCRPAKKDGRVWHTFFCSLKCGIEDHIIICIFIPSLSSNAQLICSKINLKQVSHRVGIYVFERFLTLISDTKYWSCILDFIINRCNLPIGKWYLWCFLLFWHFACNWWLWNLKIIMMELSDTKRIHWILQYRSETEINLQPFSYNFFGNHLRWVFSFQKLQFTLHSSFHPEEMDYKVFYRLW